MTTRGAAQRIIRGGRARDESRMVTCTGIGDMLRNRGMIFKQHMSLPPTLTFWPLAQTLQGSMDENFRILTFAQSVSEGILPWSQK